MVSFLPQPSKPGFDVLVTVDRNMPYQHSVENRAISVVVVRGRTTNIDDLIILMPEILAALTALKRGAVVRIGTPAD
jgi:hypothetical protein